MMRIVFALLFLPLLANADWIQQDSHTSFTIARIQVTSASSANNGALLFWAKEFDALGEPNTRFTLEFPFNQGMQFDQAKFLCSVLMTAQSQGKKIMIGVPGSATTRVPGMANPFDTIRIVD